MGAAGSVRQYKTLLKGQTPVAKKLHWFVSTLGLEDGEAASLLALYRRADAKKRGSVSWQEYAECLLLDEYHPYSKRFFDSLNDGDDGNDNLDCLEFFVGVYRWCTMSPREIMGYTFHLYAGEAGLEIDHLKTMLKEIHFISKVEKTSKSVLAGHATSLIAALKNNRADAPYSQQAFLDIMKGRPDELEPMAPIFALQNSVQVNTYGALWWERQADRLHAILLQRQLPSLDALLQAGPANGVVSDNAWILAKSRPEEKRRESSPRLDDGVQEEHGEELSSASSSSPAHTREHPINTSDGNANGTVPATRMNAPPDNSSIDLCMDYTHPSPQETDVLCLLAAARDQLSRIRNEAQVVIAVPKRHPEHVAGRGERDRWDGRHSSVIRRRSSMLTRQQVASVPHS